jgi:hypothetical protein
MEAIHQTDDLHSPFCKLPLRIFPPSDGLVEVGSEFTVATQKLSVKAENKRRVSGQRDFIGKSHICDKGKRRKKRRSANSQ